MWTIDKDNYDMVCGISYGDVRVLQLNPGTSRNEEMADIVVRVLNNEPAAVDALERAVQKIKSTDTSDSVATCTILDSETV